ncbi:MAG: sporulation protein YqfD [bacterium]
MVNIINKLWNYLKGYVIIEISGFAIERFLNLCANKNIILSEIEESKNGVLCRVNIDDFKKLKEFGKKTGCKYKIKSKYGFRFYVFENRRRGALVGGIAMFIALLYYFSGFIWAININGNKEVDSNEILKYCEENNFYLGSLKKNLDAKQLQTDIKNNFDNISWISIQVKGTSVNINISENINNNIVVVDNNIMASNITSDEEGIVHSISTKSGTPLVKQNDVIQKGDILVSGELFLKDGEEITGSYTTKSEALIKAVIETTFQVEIPYEYLAKSFTQEKVVDYKFKFFNKDFDFISQEVNFINYDKTTSVTQLKLGENYALPFIIIKDTYLEYNQEKMVYSKEDAKQQALNLISQQIVTSVDFSSDILEKKIHYDETSEDKLVATTTLKLIKEIGEEVEINVIEKPVKLKDEPEEAQEIKEYQNNN